MKTELKRSIVCQDLRVYLKTIKEKKEKVNKLFYQHRRLEEEAEGEGESMKILVECVECSFCFREDTEDPLECCPECGNPDLIEVKKDWNKE